MVEYVEFLTAKKSIAAADTYYEVEMPTPSRTGQNIQMVIHKIEYTSHDANGIPASRPANLDSAMFWLTNKSYSAAPTAPLDDPNVLDYACLQVDFAANGIQSYVLPLVKEFKIPLLVPRMKLYFGCRDGVVSNVCSIKIHYTMRWVTNKQLYDALTD